MLPELVGRPGPGQIDGALLLADGHKAGGGQLAGKRAGDSETQRAWRVGRGRGRVEPLHEWTNPVDDVGALLGGSPDEERGDAAGLEHAHDLGERGLDVDEVHDAQT